MKKYIIIVLLVYCNQYANSQDTWHRDSAMYMTAYTYILNDSINQKKTQVSPSLSFLTIE